MGNYDELKQAVSDVIKTNGNQEITGQLLQNTLLSIINTVGANATFAGTASLSTNPGTPDQNVFYIATDTGIYVNFNNIENDGSVILLRNKSGEWSKSTLNIPTNDKININDIIIVPVLNQKRSFSINENTITLYKSGFCIIYKEHIIRYTLENDLEFSSNGTHSILVIDFKNILNSLIYTGTSSFEIPTSSIYVKNADSTQDNNLIIKLFYWYNGVLQNGIGKMGKYITDYTYSILPIGNDKVSFSYNRNSVTIYKNGFVCVLNNKNYTVSSTEDKVYNAGSEYRSYLVVDIDAILNGDTNKLDYSVYVLDETKLTYRHIPIFVFYNKKPIPLIDVSFENLINGVMDIYSDTKAFSIYNKNTLRVNKTGFTLFTNGGRSINITGIDESDLPAYTNGYKDFYSNNARTLLVLDLKKINVLQNVSSVTVSLSDLEMKLSTDIISTDVVLCGWYYGQLINSVGLLSNAIINWIINNSQYERNVINDNVDAESGILSCGFRRIKDVGNIQPLCFLHISDTHTGGASSSIAQRCIEDYVKILNYYDNIKFGMITGDIIYSNFTNSLYSFNQGIKDAKKPIMITIGNHEVGNSSVIAECGTHEQVYDKFIMPYIGNWGAVMDGKNYYYKDFEDEKIRMIVLYDFDDPLLTSDNINYDYIRGTMFYSQNELDWFIQTLQNTPNDYGVLISTHVPGGGKIIGENPFVNSYGNDYQGSLYVNQQDYPIGDIVRAFINKESINKSYDTQVGSPISINADFSNKENTEFICYINGHLHMDNIGVYERYPEQTVLNIDCDNSFYTAPSDLGKKAETKSANVMNVVGIDRNLRIITVVRIGANVSNTMQLRNYLKIEY